jgi:hypothetical protein
MTDKKENNMHSTLGTRLHVGDHVAALDQPSRLLGVVAAAQEDRLLVKRAQDGKVKLFDRSALVRHSSTVRLRRSPIVDALGRPVRDGDMVQLGDGRMGTVQLALGVRATLQGWEVVPRAQRGLVIVTVDGGGTDFIKSGDLLVVCEVDR